MHGRAVEQGNRPRAGHQRADGEDPFAARVSEARRAKTRRASPAPVGRAGQARARAKDTSLKLSGVRRHVRTLPVVAWRQLPETGFFSNTLCQRLSRLRVAA